MMEQNWWQKRLPRQRPTRPLPPLSPSMLTSEHSGVQPAMDEPMPPQIAAPTAAPQDVETLGGTQPPPLVPQNTEAPSGLGTGIPTPPQPEAPAEQMPPRNSPEDSDYAQILAPPKKEKLWKDILYVAGQAAANIFGEPGQEQPIERLGETQKRRKDAPAMQRIQVRTARQKAEQEARLREEQIKTIPTDDANRKLQIEAQAQAAKDRLRTTALSKIFSGKYFDPKNKIHAQLATTAGLDPTELEGWDDRHPYTKTVAGVTYEYKNGAFVPSNLPADEAATLTDYQVKMPNGEFRTYRVAQKDAARFATQMQVLNAQIEAAAQRQQAGFGQQEKMAQIMSQLRQKDAEFTSALADKNNKASQERARAIQKEMIELRNQLKIEQDNALLQ